MDIQKYGKIHFNAPKGYGELKYKEQEINFTNAITIFGKAHIHNAILHNIWQTTPTIYKITGVSILFRRCHDDATNINPTLNKSLFEVNIVRLDNGDDATANKNEAHTKSFSLIPNSEDGHKVDGSVAYLQIGTGEVKLTAEDNAGCWGDSDSSGILLTNIWSTTANAGSSPATQNVGLKSDVTNRKKARIMGISLITGGQYGDWAIDLANNDVTGIAKSKKVWRDPAYLQLLHNQESLRKDFGNGDNVRPPVDAGGNQGSDNIREAGHYFPSITDFNTEMGSGELTIAESKEADVWKWTDVAHDTFSHTFFPTHWYSSQAGNFELPYNTDTIANDHRIDTLIQAKYDATDEEVYTTTLNTPIDFGFIDDSVVYDSTGQGANELGDGLLPSTCNVYEVDYNTAGIANPDHLVDSNDQISARYSVDFSHLATTPFNMNANYGLDNTIQSKLGENLALDFGQLGATFDEQVASPSSAITHVYLLSKDGAIMRTKNYDGTYDETNKIPITSALTSTSLQPIKFSIDQGETLLDAGSSFFADKSSERPRIWQTTIELTFKNVNPGTIGSQNYPQKNPDSVEFFNNGDSLFRVQLTDKDAEDLHDKQLPGTDPTSEVTDLFDDLNLGDDFPEGKWEDDNNLVVTLTLYTG